MSAERPRRLSRRLLLADSCHGFGAVALSALLSDRAFAGDGVGPHFTPRAKRVVFLFMKGGPSQVDTFDPKPRLQAEHGQPIKMKLPRTQFEVIGTVFPSPWEFSPRGQSGIPVSALLPQLAQKADELTIVRSMTSESSEHNQAITLLHTGSQTSGRPSMGAWASYGLGSASQNFPAFVVINGDLMHDALVDEFHNGFLPAAHQGTLIRMTDPPIVDLTADERAVGPLNRELLRKLDGDSSAQAGHDAAIDAAIANYELAFRMQAAVPELLDLRGESAATLSLYGIDQAPTAVFGRECLLARRFLERGVRFVELLMPNVNAGVGWDQHALHETGHAAAAAAVDRPVAALLTDLKARGLDRDTVVVWAGEFGRTPMAQGTNGRDHNPYGFSIWLWGAGLKPGSIYGATDDYGYFAIDGKMTVYDFQATLLHLLGFDHKRLTYRFGGRDMRLTDVHGEVVTALLGGR
jgi:hypothetical protein